MNTNGWLPELDALIAAPEHHRLLFENELVRVPDVHIFPVKSIISIRTSVRLHYISSPGVILSGMKQNGSVLVDSRTLDKTPKTGSSLWSELLAPHALKIIGANDLRVISVEIKSKK